MYVWICALCNRRPTREPRGWGSTKRFIPAAPQQNKYRTMLTIIKGSCPWKHAPYIFNRLLHTHWDYCEKEKKKKLRRKLQISNNERATQQAAEPTFRSVEDWKTNLMSLAILLHFLCAQHVSDISISIIRSLRLFCWITTSVVLFSVRCVLELWCGWF